MRVMVNNPTVSPPTSSISSVSATSGTGPAIVGTYNTNGYFEFNTIPVGTYTVTFTPTALFNAPAPQTVAVPKAFTQGSNFTITVTPTGIVPSATFTGTMGWTSGFASPTSNASCAVYGDIRNSQIFGFEGESNTLSDASGNGRKETVSLTIPVFHGVGTYAIPSEATALITVRQLSSGNAPSYRGTSGSFIVTGFNQATRTLTGTFSFAATSTTSTNTLNTTNGTILVSY
jgi:hypothetical protein